MSINNQCPLSRYFCYRKCVFYDSFNQYTIFFQNVMPTASKSKKHLG